MRVWLTGGTGFVGSNIVHVALARGDQVMTTVHRFQPEASIGYQTDQVDLTDQPAVHTSIDRFGPGVVVHCAILNDFAALYRDRKAAWDAYVTATATTAAAARSIGAPCARALRFGAGISLEELIIRHALGRPVEDLTRERAASGVMMLPIPRAGKLVQVDGQEEARGVPGIAGLEITIAPGRPVQP
ncbi:MAG: NAD-dependent epimerase/dehydratase family protein, partial [bacterium]